MSDFNIQVTNIGTGEITKIDTDGYLLLSLEQNKVKVIGKVDIKALAPILTRIALERLSK